MKSSMKVILLGVLMLMAAMIVPAYGQSTSEGLTFDIPFNFTVEQQRLPAGQYLVTISGQNGLLMRRIDGRGAVVVLTQAIVSQERRETARLVFNCYDRRCFLSQAWPDTGSMGRLLLKSSEEQELASMTKQDPTTLLARKR